MKKPRLTKYDKMLQAFLEKSNLEMEANIQVQHTNEAVAQAFTIMIQALGIRLAPIVTVNKKKVAPKKKKEVAPKKKKK